MCAVRLGGGPSVTQPFVDKTGKPLPVLLDTSVCGHGSNVDVG